MQKHARYATEDFVPQGASGDAEFQRVVQQIQELHHTRGYLHAKGAFDKEDQAYLRDAEERRKYVEEALAEREKAEFLEAQAKAVNVKRDQVRSRDHVPKSLHQRKGKGEDRGIGERSK
jgi:hypothetical protein